MGCLADEKAQRRVLEKGVAGAAGAAGAAGWARGCVVGDPDSGRRAATGNERACGAPRPRHHAEDEQKDEYHERSAGDAVCLQLLQVRVVRAAAGPGGARSHAAWGWGVRYITFEPGERDCECAHAVRGECSHAVW